MIKMHASNRCMPVTAADRIKGIDLAFSVLLALIMNS